MHANLGQQQYFADALTKAILPNFVQQGQPFVVVYWSRDPDGTQHNGGDSLNSLTPGINGPTSRAAVKNADSNLAQILAYINSDPKLASNTDIFVTSDHGFATISKHEIDGTGKAFTASYAAQFTYKDSSGRQEVNAGFLPPGFLAIDLAHALGMPLFDPDTQIKDSTGQRLYERVDPTVPQQSATIRQHPNSGNGLIGASGRILDVTDAKVIVAANGGSDLIYVPDHDKKRVQQIVAFLSKADYVGAILVENRYGKIPGALPFSSINLIGASKMPRPDIAVSFKTFYLSTGRSPERGSNRRFNPSRGTGYAWELRARQHLQHDGCSRPGLQERFCGYVSGRQCRHCGHHGTHTRTKATGEGQAYRARIE